MVRRCGLKKNILQEMRRVSRLRTILECENVSKYFGDFAALKDVSFKVKEDSIFGIAGPNGAGKTTLFNILTSCPFPTSSGKIFFEGEEIQHLQPYEIVHKGIARTFQNPVIFKNLTYENSVKVGAIYGNLSNLSKNIIQYRKSNIEDKVQKSLDLVDLTHKKNNYTIHASLLDLKLLMIASAIATEPKILLLDEPVSGLTGGEIEIIWDLITKLRKETSMSMIIIEHIMKFLMNISDEVMVLNYGEVVCEGVPKDVSRDERVIECYLGEEFKELSKRI
jgi:branched-chain amino acid transport system ATP-binding protein